MSRKLDALVATRVMGWSPHPSSPEYTWVDIWVDSDGTEHHIFEPSSFVHSAWQVVEQHGHMVHLHKISGTTYRKDCTNKSLGWMYRCRFGKDQQWSYGTDVCEAICLAALRAVGVTAEEIEAACKEGK